jgi:hypothetical protein
MAGKVRLVWGGFGGFWQARYGGSGASRFGLARQAWSVTVGKDRQGAAGVVRQGVVGGGGEARCGRHGKLRSVGQWFGSEGYGRQVWVGSVSAGSCAARQVWQGPGGPVCHGAARSGMVW